MENYDIFLNCDNFKKLTGDIVSGQIEFNFKEFYELYRSLLDEDFLEDYYSNITSISFIQPSTLIIESNNKHITVTNRDEIFDILSEMAEEFETFASEYEDSLNEFSDFGLW